MSQNKTTRFFIITNINIIINIITNYNIIITFIVANGMNKA